MGKNSMASWALPSDVVENPKRAFKNLAADLHLLRQLKTAPYIGPGAKCSVYERCLQVGLSDVQVVALCLYLIRAQDLRRYEERLVNECRRAAGRVRAAEAKGQCDTLIENIIDTQPGFFVNLDRRGEGESGKRWMNQYTESFVKSYRRKMEYADAKMAITRHFKVGKSYAKLPRRMMEKTTLCMSAMVMEKTGKPHDGLVGQLLYEADLARPRGKDPMDRFRALQQLVKGRRSRASKKK